MKILLSYYSRKGHTEKLAKVIQKELESLGHEFEVEVIKPRNLSSRWWVLVSRCLPGVPFILFSTFLFRLKRYLQPEADIEPLQYPDVSGFDRVIIGGPKWMHLSFPVAKYLKQVKGLSSKQVGGFSTFCGPPSWEGFEMYSYFFPFNEKVRAGGGEVIAQLGISSGHTDVLLLPSPFFRMVSRVFFKKQLSEYGIDSEWGRENIARFCDLVEKEVVSAGELQIP